MLVNNNSNKKVFSTTVFLRIAPQLLLLLLGPKEEPLPPGKGGLQVLEGLQHQAAVVLDMLGLEGNFLHCYSISD